MRLASKSGGKRKKKERGDKVGAEGETKLSSFFSFFFSSLARRRRRRRRCCCCCPVETEKKTRSFYREKEREKKKGKGGKNLNCSLSLSAPSLFTPSVKRRRPLRPPSPLPVPAAGGSPGAVLLRVEAAEPRFELDARERHDRRPRADLLPRAVRVAEAACWF